MTSGNDGRELQASGQDDAAVVARQGYFAGVGDRMARASVLWTLRVLSGGVFVVFGAGKFVNHAAELDSFKSYGLPVPALCVIAVGAIELAGGGLLISGRLLRPTALMLAGDMVGAIVVSGLARGEIISLTLAPALLIAMLVELWAELTAAVEPPGEPLVRRRS